MKIRIMKDQTQTKMKLESKRVNGPCYSFIAHDGESIKERVIIFGDLKHESSRLGRRTAG